MEKGQTKSHAGRRGFLTGTFVIASALLLWRAADLQIFSAPLLRQHGDARSVRDVAIAAHRGMIVDRNGEPLAISTPVSSVWVTPKEVPWRDARLAQLARVLEIEPAALRGAQEMRLQREFVYVKRQVTPDQAEMVSALRIPGVHLEREYKRYYPAGEIAAHVIGFTNVDDSGQEGMELAFDHWLRGEPGVKRVLKDRIGRTVQDIESIRPPAPGKLLELSIDRRLQYLAYRELKLAVAANGARGGSMVMLDPATGEVLAMAAQPSFNPNNRSGFKNEFYRNRPATDLFEPGSTLKPFTIAAALQSGRFTPATIIETGPGVMAVSNHFIRDIRDFGTIDVANVIRKSSNVGASRIALSLGPEPLWQMFRAVGFGRGTGSGFPGEATGQVQGFKHWSELELATAAFGYGISVTALQLAQAYAVIANEGVLRPVSLQKQSGRVPGQPVMPAAVAAQVRAMLETVVEPDGTGHRAAVRGYRVAGKTGTVHKAVAGGYAENRYLSLFAGFAPASAPRLVLVVMIDEPQMGEYYGGLVAAPVFARIMHSALRIFAVPPDDLPALEGRVVVAGQDASTL
ncbi:MAG: penicillin-binding protein 2 [Gammaproteobacteria bacterium]|nr:penicillin-binding protein 2 [Gammaproteobacteria bacterium]